MSSRFDHDLIDRHAPADAPRKSTDDARQAEAPHEVRYMLGFGLAGVVIAFAIIYAIFWL